MHYKVLGLKQKWLTLFLVLEDNKNSPSLTKTSCKINFPNKVSLIVIGKGFLSLL